MYRSSAAASFSVFSAGSSAFSDPSTPGLAERLREFRASRVQMLLALLLVDEPADARARLAGDDEPFPLRRRRAAACRHDLDLVAVLQLMAQRQQPAVDLRADAGIAHLRVHRIGEVHRRRAARQLDQLALRREAEDLVLVEFQLGILEEFVRRGRILQNLQQVLHPAETLQIASVGLGIRLLVNPVRGDAVFRHVVHLVGADLDLDLLVARLAQRHAGVQALIAVRLRRRDVVLEPSGDHRIRRVHRAERRVTRLLARHHDAECHDVGKLLEGDVAPMHLLPDRVGRLLAPGHFDHRARRSLSQTRFSSARTSSITSAPWPRRKFSRAWIVA